MKKLLLILLAALCSMNVKAQYTKLHDFYVLNGNRPRGDLYSDGSFLYGMTAYGGPYYDGVIFKIKPDGTGYVEIFNFNGPDGYAPSGTLISDGTFLYGTAGGGGADSNGMVFKI